MTTITGKRKKVVASEPVTYENIAARAYDLYVQRGQVDGFAVTDWLAAEAELRMAAVPAVKKRASKKTVASTKTSTKVSTKASSKASLKVSTKVPTEKTNISQPKPRQRKTASAPTKQPRA